jgi:hypothetical protein
MSTHKILSFNLEVSTWNCKEMVIKTRDGDKNLLLT